MEDGHSIVIQDVANASGFKNNALSVSLLGRRRLSAEPGANPCLRNCNTAITIHKMSGLYITDMYRAEARNDTSIYTTIEDTEDAPRSNDDVDNESYEEHDSWLDEGDSDDDEEQREGTAAAIAAHAETDTQRGHDQWGYYNWQPAWRRTQRT